MTPKDDLRADVGKLRKDAKVWDAEGEAIAEAGSRASELEMDLDVAGIIGKWSGLVSKYEGIRGNLVERFHEGSTYFASVGDTLQFVADWYERNEANTGGTFNQINPD